jgi:hypothetical protein
MAKSRNLVEIKGRDSPKSGDALKSSIPKNTRKRVSVAISNEVKDIYISKDNLPEYQPYFDTIYDKGVGNSHIENTRIFLEDPTKELQEASLQKKKEVEACGKKFKTTGSGNIFDRFGQLIKNPKRTKIPLYNYCIDSGFSSKFSKDICRLFIRSYKEKQIKRDHFRGILGAVEKMVSQLKICISNDDSIYIDDFGILNITTAHWQFIAKKYPHQDKFAAARDVFSSYPPTSLNGTLNRMRVSESGYSDIKSLDEHTSILFMDKGYTDAEMYQINAILLSYIYKHQNAIERYNGISEQALAGSNKVILGKNTLRLYKEVFNEDISGGWLSPDVVSLLMSKCKGSRNNDSKYMRLKDALISDLIVLHQDGDLFELAIDTNLVWYKKVGKIINDVARKHQTFEESGAIVGFFNKDLLGLYKKGSNGNSWISFYSGKNATMKRFNHLHAWCLANFLRIVTGINKEVALSIPSRTRGGKSILDREQSLYRSNKKKSSEIELYGVKFRSNDSNLFKHIVLGKQSAIYKHFKFYESNLKNDFSGDFLEITTSVGTNWSTCGICYEKTENKDIPDFFKFYDRDGILYTRYECERFRKVYATQKFLQLIRDTNDPIDLVSKFKDALFHKELDVGLNAYLMKDPNGRGTLDAAIVAITSNKLEEALSFKGQILLNSTNKDNRKKVFLCECSDPFNPSHNYYIADECKHYDLCLGCKRSVITKEHLPYICVRIIQYEKAKKQNPQNWSVMFEDKWMIAHDALNKYQEMAKDNGKQIIAEAWEIAKSDEVLLPPIIEGGL